MEWTRFLWYLTSPHRLMVKYRWRTPPCCGDLNPFPSSTWLRDQVLWARQDFCFIVFYIVLYYTKLIFLKRRERSGWKKQSLSSQLRFLFPSFVPSVHSIIPTDIHVNCLQQGHATDSTTQSSSIKEWNKDLAQTSTLHQNSCSPGHAR